MLKLFSSSAARKQLSINLETQIWFCLKVFLHRDAVILSCKELTTDRSGCRLSSTGFYVINQFILISDSLTVWLWRKVCSHTDAEGMRLKMSGANTVYLLKGVKMKQYKTTRIKANSTYNMASVSHPKVKKRFLSIFSILLKKKEEVKWCPVLRPAASSSGQTSQICNTVPQRESHYLDLVPVEISAHVPSPEGSSHTAEGAMYSYLFTHFFKKPNV